MGPSRNLSNAVVANRKKRVVLGVSAWLTNNKV
jgi:hypothetical protein